MMNYINNKFNEIKNRPFVKDVVILQAGNIFATGISFVSSIVFARVLKVDNYGLYGLIFAFASFLGMFLSWGGKYAVTTLLPEVLENRDKEGIKNLINYFFKIVIIPFIFIGIPIIIFAPQISQLFYSSAEIGKLARILVVVNFVATIFHFFVIILHCLRKIKALSILDNINRITYSLFSIAAVLLGFGVVGIVYSRVIVMLIFLVVSFLSYSVVARQNDLLPTWKDIFSSIVKIRIKKYLKFSFLITVDNNIGSFFTSLPILLLGIVAPPSQVAFFKIAFTYIGLSGILYGPISKILAVQLPKSKAYGKHILKTDFTKFLSHSTLIGLALMIFFLVVAKPAITIFFGENYLPSIKIIYALGLIIATKAMASGTAPLLRTLQKMKLSIYLNGFLLLSSIISLGFLLQFFSPLMSIIIITLWLKVVGALGNLCIAYFYLNKIKEPV